MTQGHHPTHTGLQKHSVGDIYPLAIVGVGDKWELHDLSSGAVMCFTGGPNAGKPVRSSLPSTLYGCLHMHRDRGIYCWTVPTVKRGPSSVLGPDVAPSAEPKSNYMPLTGNRAGWYGEAGTDADLPPPGAEVKALMTVTEQEQALISAYRYCLPTMRECILTLVRKCKA